MNYKRNTLADETSDRNCCVALAMAAIFDTTFQDATIELATLGRKRHHRTSLAISRAMMRSLGLEERHGCGITLAEFVKRNSSGAYLVFTCDHALAVVGGVVIDNLPPRPRCRIVQFWKVQ